MCQFPIFPLFSCSPYRKISLPPHYISKIASFELSVYFEFSDLRVVRPLCHVRVVHSLCHVISLAPFTSELSVRYESHALARQFFSFFRLTPEKLRCPTLVPNEAQKCPRLYHLRVPALYSLCIVS